MWYYIYMKTNKGFAHIAVLIIIFAALLVASVYMFSLGKKAPVQNPASQNQVVSEKESTDIVDANDPSGNIYIYTSYKLGIVFKYPKTMEQKFGPSNNLQVAKIYFSLSEVGDRLYLDANHDGINFQNEGNRYFVEFLNKDQNESFKDSIEKKFITNKNDCFVETTQSGYFIVRFDPKKVPEGEYWEGPVHTCGPNPYYLGNFQILNDFKYMFVKSAGQEPYFGIGEVLNFWPPKLGRNLELINQ